MEEVMTFTLSNIRVVLPHSKQGFLVQFDLESDHIWNFHRSLVHLKVIALLIFRQNSFEKTHHWDVGGNFSSVCGCQNRKCSAVYYGIIQNLVWLFHTQISWKAIHTVIYWHLLNYTPAYAYNWQMNSHHSSKFTDNWLIVSVMGPRCLWLLLGRTLTYLRHCLNFFQCLTVVQLKHFTKSCQAEPNVLAFANGILLFLQLQQISQLHFV